MSHADRIRRLMVKALPLALAAVLAAPTHAADVPIGDCNEDGCVLVNELMIGLQIMQQALPPEACPALECNGSLFIHIDCLISAVGNALRLCPTIEGAQ